jgi:hypothetical protein
LLLTESLPTKELAHPEPFNSNNSTNGSSDGQDPMVPLTVDHTTTRIGLQTDATEGGIRNFVAEQHSKTKSKVSVLTSLKSFRKSW